MSGISGISYENYASGKAIYKAADNAAGLSISEKLKNQENGYNKGTENAGQGIDMINTAEQALSSISDSLGRMRELSLQAMNTATMSSEDIANINDEIQELKKGIEDVARGTEYNKISLLDNENAYHLALNPDGSGKEIQMVNATLKELGIDDYDVTKDFDISKLDEASQKISDTRAKLGATTNGLESAINSNNISSLETLSSRSKIEDLDYAKASTEINKKNLIEQYKIFMQKKKAEMDKQSKLGLFN